MSRGLSSLIKDHLAGGASRLAALLACALLLAPVIPVIADALMLSLTPAEMERALAIARRPDRERAAFHPPYIVRLNDATVEQMEVITEFRRLVLLGEERVAQGDSMFTRSVRTADAALRPWRGRVSIVARLRFHPQNVLISVPPYQIAVSGSPEGPPITPIESRTTPLSSLPFPTARGDTTALVGAVLESQFDAAAIGQTRRTVGVVLDGKTIAQTPIDFARID